MMPPQNQKKSNHRMSEKNRTSIGVSVFDRLDVELMDFKLMPGRRAVSLIHPAGAYNEESRIINLGPQVALNLLAWLEQERDTLTQILEEETPQE
jgi:hypothetical protein